jgi:hypothetical protein
MHKIWAWLRRENIEKGNVNAANTMKWWNFVLAAFYALRANDLVNEVNVVYWPSVSHEMTLSCAHTLWPINLSFFLA